MHSPIGIGFQSANFDGGKWKGTILLEGNLVFIWNYRLKELQALYLVSDLVNL